MQGRTPTFFQTILMYKQKVSSWDLNKWINIGMLKESELQHRRNSILFELLKVPSNWGSQNDKFGWKNLRSRLVDSDPWETRMVKKSDNQKMKKTPLVYFYNFVTDIKFFRTFFGLPNFFVIFPKNFEIYIFVLFNLDDRRKAAPFVIKPQVLLNETQFIAIRNKNVYTIIWKYVKKYDRQRDQNPPPLLNAVTPQINVIYKTPTTLQTILSKISKLEKQFFATAFIFVFFLWINWDFCFLLKVCQLYDWFSIMVQHVLN